MANASILTAAERDAFLNASMEAERPVRTFCNILYYTGCRISEALALTPNAFDYSGNLIVFETLKRRRKGVYRAVPMAHAYCISLLRGSGIAVAAPSSVNSIDPLTQYSGLVMADQVDSYKISI